MYKVMNSHKKITALFSNEDETKKFSDLLKF